MRTHTRHFVFVLLIAVAWVAPLSAAAEGDLDRGQEIFDLCTQCHGPDGGGNQMALAPAIAGLDEWYVKAQLEKFQSGIRGTNPHDMGGLRMYPMSLSLYHEGDIDDVAAYVASMPPAPPAPTIQGGDAAKGAVTWATCKTCHGDNAEGKQPQGAPPLRNSSDWYLFESLNKFKAGIRGAAPGDAFGAAMAGMARALLPDEQAMKDVIAHVMTLREQQ
jgi:cytochrome c553